jgi:hypothetical protein
MKFKNGDFLVLSECGLNSYYEKDAVRRKKMKTTLFIMNQHINEQKIYVNRMSGKPILSYLLTKNFRLATSMEIKIYTIKFKLTIQS